MIFFYYGEDSFRAYQKIQAITQKFIEKIDKDSHNILHLDGEGMKASDFFRAVTAMGFLATKKLIIVKNIFDNGQLKNFQDDLLDWLKKQADSPEENYVIFWQSGKVDSRTKLYKTLTKFKFVEEFNKLSPNELNTWLIKEVTDNKKSINQKALDLLISYVGNDLWQLNQEISKLTHFSQKEITDDDVRTIVQAKIDDNIFNLIDALGNKDKAMSLKLIEDHLKTGASHQYILTMIIRQFRLIIKAKALGGQISYAGALMQALKLPNMVANKILAQSKKYSMEQLKEIYKQLLLLDEKFKTTSNQEKILFTQMINNL